MLKLRPNLEKTNKVMTNIAAVALNLAIIGVSAVIVKSSIDTLWGNKIRKKIANFRLRRQMKKAKVVGPDAPMQTEPLESDKVEPAKPAKKSSGKKSTKKECTDVPMDNAMPTGCHESQE